MQVAFIAVEFHLASALEVPLWLCSWLDSDSPGYQKEPYGILIIETSRWCQKALSEDKLPSEFHGKAKAI